MCMDTSPAYNVCAPHGVPGDQRPEKVPDTSYHVGTGNQTQVLCENSIFDYQITFQHPPFLFKDIISLCNPGWLKSLGSSDPRLSLARNWVYGLLVTTVTPTLPVFWPQGTLGTLDAFSSICLVLACFSKLEFPSATKTPKE